ncbi:MAG: DUF4232 domain-containing protein [Thermomicrobiales bacterium]
MQRWLMRLAAGLLIAGLAFGAAAFRAPQAHAADEQHCFDTTGKCVGPLFFAYWQAHGGLAINGYPVSDEQVEVLENGQPYTVQYFERVRMEYHPENVAPYTVLLGQFGRHFHPADPPVDPQPGAHYFQPTGQNVSGAFLDYWQANGGLAQFGYPLSETFQQQLEDGHTYTVQYFERARFELHPENQPPYNVELGQFGRRILAENSGQVVAACQAAHLSASLVMQGAAGSREGAIQLINETAAPCSLSGRPQAQLVDENSAPITDVTITDAPRDPATEGVTTVGVGRGQAFAIRVRWSNYCGRPVDKAQVVLLFPGGVPVYADWASVPPCLGAGEGSTFSVGPYAVGGQEQAAANVVLGYFGAINAQDYQSAYAAFGAQMQSQQSYNDFAQGFATTKRADAYQIVIGGSDTPGAYQIALHLAATQTDGSVQYYSGTYLVGPENGALKILGANVQPTTGP